MPSKCLIVNFHVDSLLDKKSLRFISSHQLGRLATASKDGMPHVTPVVYAMDGDSVIVAIDYKTKKLANLKVNPQISFVVDSYRPNSGVMIQGKCLIYERGPEYLRLQKILFERFEFYRKNPWGEGESPILKVVPIRAVSWGMK